MALRDFEVSAAASPIPARCCATRSQSARPSSVNSTARLVRCTSPCRDAPSSLAIALLTPDCVMPSRSAALPKLRAFADGREDHEPADEPTVNFVHVDASQIIR